MIDSESTTTEVKNAFKNLISNYNNVEDCFHAFVPNKDGFMAIEELTLELKLSSQGNIHFTSILEHLVRSMD